MTQKIEQKMKALGLETPPDWPPRGDFLPFRKDGPIVYLSGQICEWDGAVTHAGPVMDTPEGIAKAQTAARVCALNLLYRLREACEGELDRVDVILRLGGFVNCQPGFGQSPAVINGATGVFTSLFGDHGWHARTAVGVCGLPGNASVEVDAVVRLKD
jgi:enamine deaminase RidA (YjgF/YER057c/UK114 family)